MRALAALVLAAALCASGLAHSAPDAGAAACSADAALGAAAPLSPAEEATSRLLELGKVSDAEDHLERTFNSPAHKRAATLLKSWMEEAGLRAWVDVVGNVHGRVEGSQPCPALMLGSHYDTVIDGGLYDGALGVVVAISALKAALRELAPGSALRCPVEIVAFSDEEGVRFQSTFLGSKVIAGTLPFAALNVTDAAGTTLAEALRPGADLGALYNDVQSQAATPGSVRAYVEVHIEQGPVLEGLGLPVGVVSAIAGQTRLAVSVTGEQGHAGTVPMSLRRDALAGAAEAIVLMEQRCKAEAEAEGLVCTVGQIIAAPGASNVIAGVVNFTIDIRARRDSVREGVVDHVITKIEVACKERRLGCAIQRKHDAGAMECSPALRGNLEAAAAAVNSLHATVAPVPVLVSGAGHDGLAMADFCPVSMLFVRCRGGVSHSPAEFVSPADVGAAVDALLHFLRAEA